MGLALNYGLEQLAYTCFCTLSFELRSVNRIRLFHCVVVNALDSRSRDRGSNLVRDLSALLANLALMSTCIVHCRPEDETSKGRTCQPPSYAEANTCKRKLLSLPNFNCLGVNFRDCPSLIPFFFSAGKAFGFTE